VRTFRDVVRARRMVRAYDGRPVDPAALERIVDLVRRAPSAGNAQGQHLVVVTDATLRARIAELAGEPAATARGLPPWLSTAPVLVVPCVRPVDYERRYAQRDKAASRPITARAVPWPWVDAGQTLMLLLLAAVDEGLAAGLLDVADHDALRAALAIPDDAVPLGVVTIGHPAADAAPTGSALRPRRDDVTHWNGWR
jgi:FMN reductase [NAD(P)H]